MYSVSNPVSIRSLIYAVVKCEDFSSFKRLLRVTAYVMKFVRVLKINHNQMSHYTCETFDCDLARAEIYCIRIMQESLLKDHKPILWKQQFGLFLTTKDCGDVGND